MTTATELQDRTCLQLERRAGAMQRDITAWTGAARTEAMGLSGPQRAALLDMLTVLGERQRTALAALHKDLPMRDFADKYAAVLVEVTGGHEVWRVFRTILDQLEDPELGGAVKSAGRVAADCYAAAILRARELHAIEPDRFREAPLVYLEATESPATAGRGDRAQALSATVRQWRNLKLPLPIVLLPSDYIDSIWSYCALHHEVGHNLDQDLKLLAQLRAALPDTVNAAQEPHWRRWSREIIADALAIVLGGAGFALSLGTMALMLGPGARYDALDEDAVHPPLILRAQLLAELLRRSDVAAHKTYADDLLAAWTALPKPPWLDAFTAQTEAVAALFLETKLDVLKDRTLVDLNPNAGRDHEMAEQLANYLVTGKNRPVPTDAAMSPRLVPLAAQLAIWHANPIDANVLVHIQDAASAYLALIVTQWNLATVPAIATERRNYHKELIRNIDFTKLDRRED